VSLKEVKREIARTRERSKIHLTPEEEREFIKKYKSARKMTLQRLMTQTSKKDSKFPQPVRTQPVMEIFTSKDNDYSIAQRIVKLTAKDVKRWGDLIIADVKYDGCYDDTTEVLTRNGWKLFKDVTYDDEIATLEDGEYLCYYKPNAIIVEDFDGEMIHIENSTLDLLVTPNHQLYVDVIDRGGHRKGEYEFVRADEFERGIFKRSAVWLGNDTDYFVLEGVYSKSIPEYRNAVRIPMRLWAEFMGYWLSEGWISVKRANSQTRQTYEVGIAQSKSRHYAIMRKCVERLTDILGVKIFDISENIRFSDKRLWLYLRQFGKAGSKFVPKEIKEATPEIIKIFLDAYTLGDGTKRSNYWQIYSTSERMIDDLQELVLKAGYAGRKVVKFEPYIAKESSKLRGRFCNRLFALHIYKNGKKSRLETRIYPEIYKNQRLEKVHYTGKVYCVNVPNHVIYVRRNGKAVWCGNCRAMLVVDPKRRDVRILSRRLKPFKKFRKKYKEMILESLSPLVKDQSVFDAELYALSKDGKIIPGHVVSGWVRNPDDEKYSNIKPSVQVFDIVMFNKKDLRGLPLKYRKRLLEIALRDSGILQVADTRRMKNSSRLIDWLFNSKVKRRGFEGLVLKDPESVYFYNKPKDNRWRKVKSVDTLDLRLVATEAYPSDKPFRFYKHWRMSPQDSEMIVKADKAIKAAGFDNDFYIGFTKRLLDKWQRGEIKADESAGMVKVDKKFRDIYGVPEVPRKLILGDKGPIVELFVEKMSETLQPSGTKIVRIRDDKEVADTLADMLQLKNLLLGRK